MVLPFRSSRRICGTFMSARLLRQACGIPERSGKICPGMYQIHGFPIGKVRYKAKRTDMAQQNAGQFSLRVLQAASPHSMDMLGEQKNTGQKADRYVGGREQRASYAFQ